MNNPKSSQRPNQAAIRVSSKITESSDWLGKTLGALCKISHDADPVIVEEWKSTSVPVRSHREQVLAVGAFEDKLKMNFFKGASLPGPHKLFRCRALRPRKYG
jgi:hypothetical protein